MLLKPFLFGAFALGVLASPTPEAKRGSSSYDDDLEWISKDSSLPKVV